MSVMDFINVLQRRMLEGFVSFSTSILRSSPFLISLDPTVHDDSSTVKLVGHKGGCKLGWTSKEPAVLAYPNGAHGGSRLVGCVFSHRSEHQPTEPDQRNQWRANRRFCSAFPDQKQTKTPKAQLKSAQQPRPTCRFLQTRAPLKPFCASPPTLNAGEMHVHRPLRWQSPHREPQMLHAPE